MDELKKLLNPNAPVDYSAKTLDLIKKHEGFRDLPYDDGKGNSTIGYGFNLNAPDTKSFVESSGYSQGPMTQEMGDAILSNIFKHKEDKLKNTLPEVFDKLPPGQKTALMSLYYNSPGLIGPNVRNLATTGDSVGLAKEILVNSNKNNELGVFKRRLDEASQVHDLAEVSKHLNPEEKLRLKQILDNSDNENVKREIIEQYGTALGLSHSAKPMKFSKLLK